MKEKQPSKTKKPYRRPKPQLTAESRALLYRVLHSKSKHRKKRKKDKASPIDKQLGLKPLNSAKKPKFNPYDEGGYLIRCSECGSELEGQFNCPKCGKKHHGFIKVEESKSEPKPKLKTKTKDRRKYMREYMRKYREEGRDRGA